jgi:hypothetical protein
VVRHNDGGTESAFDHQTADPASPLIGEALKMLFVTESGGHWYRRLFAPRETRQIDRDIGRIEAIDAEAHTILVRYEDRRVRYETTELHEITLAYAVSVHKSQGSEFPAVIVPVLIQHYLLLQRNLIYTAVTRGKQLVIVIGTRKALAIALKYADTRERCSGLRARLAGWPAGEIRLSG